MPAQKQPTPEEEEVNNTTQIHEETDVLMADDDVDTEENGEEAEDEEDVGEEEEEEVEVGEEEEVENHNNQEENGGQGDDNNNNNEEEEEEEENKEEFISVRLADIRKEVQCPICLGILRKTRTVMECLHRFCRECIDRSMRTGNNECPTCRTHCPSRRALRDDPNFDALIAVLYPDIDQIEEEELEFQEEEIARNQQIQDSIAETFRRQTEALSKKRKKSQGNYKRGRSYRSDDEEDVNDHDGGKDLSSADERTEVRSRRSKRWRGQPSSVGTSVDGGDNEHDPNVQKESGVAATVLVGSPEMLAWGKGGIRSNTRHGTGGGNGKHSRNRVARLVEHLRNLQEDDNELDIQVVLLSLDEQNSASLEHSFLSGRPALSVGQLCQFIALQTSLPAEGLEILASKAHCTKSTEFEVCKDDLKVLSSEETLAGLKSTCNFARGHLMLAYRQKLSA